MRLCALFARALTCDTLISPSLHRSDVAGAALWSVALFYASPVQLLLLFLGRIDVERPSDATLLCALFSHGRAANRCNRCNRC